MGKSFDMNIANFVLLVVVLILVVVCCVKKPTEGFIKQKINQSAAMRKVAQQTSAVNSSTDHHQVNYLRLHTDGGVRMR
jgi:hypothetical protein